MFGNSFRMSEANPRRNRIDGRRAQEEAQRHARRLRPWSRRRGRRGRRGRREARGARRGVDGARWHPLPRPRGGCLTPHV